MAWWSALSADQERALLLLVSGTLTSARMETCSLLGHDSKYLELFCESMRAQSPRCNHRKGAAFEMIPTLPDPLTQRM